MSATETAETARKRAEIERTRAEMSGTIDAIQEKLNPQHIAEQVRHTVQEQIEGAKATVRDATIGKAEDLMRDASERVSDVRYTLNDTIRHNPIPAAMVALGLGWLFMNRSSRPRPRRYEGRYDSRYAQQYGQGRPMMYESGHPIYRGEAVAMYPTGQQQDEGRIARAQHAVGDAASTAKDAVGNAASTAKDAVGSAASTAKDAVGDAAGTAKEAVGGAINQAQRAMGGAAHRVQDTAGHLAGRTVYQAERLEDRFQQTLIENPLALGAVALAVGAAVGFGLPQTERENQLMGEARDNLVEQAQSTAQETIEKVQQVAGEVAQDAQHKASEKAREVGLTGDKR